MKVIVSTNEDPKYFGFWPYVAKAYKLMGYEPHLAFLTWRKENDPIVTELRQHGEVTLYEPNGLAPEFGQAKMIRFLLASEQGETVCYVEDIDLIPLSKDFIESKVSQRPKDTLLCVGGEVYGHTGCYPISQMTAEGYIWKRFINPNDLSLHDLVEYEWGKDGQYDEKENIFTQPTRNFDKYFSDEKLMRRLLTENPVPKHEMERGYGRVLDHTIDRMNWQIDYDKLIKDGYVNAHCQRPINVPDTETLLNYLHDKYSQDIQTN